MCPNREHVKSIFTTIAKYLLIVLFVSYYVGGTAFTHTHYFPTYSITHSHPFLPGADGLPHHTHNSSAFNTIEELDDIMMEAAALCLIIGDSLGTSFRVHSTTQVYNSRTFST